MSDLAFVPLVRRAASLASDARTRVLLHAIDRLGEGARVEGRPLIENHGRIVVGTQWLLRSTPQRSHLYVAEDAAIHIGDRVTMGSGSGIAAHRWVEIGDDVVIGDRVLILDTDYHDANDLAKPGARAPIVIERGARIDDDVVVLKGSHIGTGVHVERGSVVAGNLPDGVRAAGNPARARIVDGAGNDVAEQVARAVAATFGTRATASTRLGELPGFDSLTALRFLVTLEDVLQKSMPAEAALAATTIERVMDLAR